MNRQKLAARLGTHFINNSLLANRFSLGYKAWHGAARALLFCTFMLYISIFLGGGVYSFFNGLINLGFAILLAVLSLSLGSLIVTFLDWIQKIQLPYRSVLMGSLFLLMSLMIAAVQLAGNAVIVVVYFIIAASLLGAGVGGLIAAIEEGHSRKAPTALGVIGFLGLCFFVIWSAWPGQSYEASDPASCSALQPLLNLEHPAEAGPYTVLELTYGSGKDKRRQEYRRDAAIITEEVDLSQMIDEPLSLILWLRNKYWGFGLDAVPLNARVWYPKGDGPFPLVLVVHGNHLMDDFSDPGYDYLGELLASRGYIAASIDQNFLNAGGFIEAVLGGLKNENDARAYLLLKHLSLWHAWNEEEGNPFYGMVDTENVGLIGHSRGGEAAAIAAAFNDLLVHPDHGDIHFDFGYNIQAVIAIAPSDGQFKPRRQGIKLSDINYLVLHGSADSDVRSFQGLAQYDRVSLTEGSDYFKAAVYIHGANHGQFNTRWGRIDQTISRFFLDRSNIMPPQAQELAAKVFISGFLEDALQGRREYRLLFAEPSWGQNWFSDTFYQIQFRDGTATIIADFEEDMDLTTLSIEGGKALGKNLRSWSEEPVELGDGRLRDTTSLRLSWHLKCGGVASYTLMMPENLTGLLSAKALTFAVANISEDRGSVDFTIIIEDHAGEQAALPLSHISALPPSPQYRTFKKPLTVQFLSEPVYTTYTFLLSDFTKVNSAFDPRGIVEIHFVFDSLSGAIYLDDVGLLPSVYEETR